MQWLEVVARRKHGVERAGARAQPIVQCSQRVGAVALDRHVQLEYIGPTRALKAAWTNVPRACFIGATEEVRCCLRKRAIEVALLLHQQQPGGEWQQQRLVGIPGDGTRAFNARDTMPMYTRHHCRPPVCRVDVQPEVPVCILVFRARVSDRVEIVKASRRRAPGRCDHGHHTSVRTLQLLELGAQHGHIHASIDGRNHNHALQTESELARRTRDGVVRVFATHEYWRVRRNAMSPDIRNGARTRRQQRRESSFGSSRCHHPAGTLIPSDQISHPRHDLSLERRERRRHLAHGQRLVERADQCISPHCGRQRCGYLMADVHRMRESIHIFEQICRQSARHFGQWTPLSRQFGFESIDNCLRGMPRGHGSSTAPGRREILGGQRQQWLSGGKGRIRFELRVQLCEESSGLGFRTHVLIQTIGRSSAA